MGAYLCLFLDKLQTFDDGFCTSYDGHLLAIAVANSLSRRIYIFYFYLSRSYTHKEENTRLRGCITVCLTSCLFSFGFSCIAYVELTSDLLVWSNPNQPNRRSAYSDTTPYGECYLHKASPTIS